MMRKLFLIGGAVALLLGLVFGRSHIATTVGLVKQQVKDNVPIDFEIKRAKQMIKDLEPEIARNLRVIAQEEVEVAKLEGQYEDTSSRLAQDRDDILRLKGDLESGSEVFVYAGHSYSAREVKADLVSRFKQFTTQAETAEAVKKVLLARQAGLRAAREKLDVMLDSKNQLLVEVENHEARLKMVEVKQAASDLKVDDSQLARTKELIDEIGTRLEVAEKLVNADVHYFDRIQLEEPEGEEDITDSITKYFGEDRAALELYVKDK